MYTVQTKYSINKNMLYLVRTQYVDSAKDTTQCMLTAQRTPMHFNYMLYLVHTVHKDSAQEPMDFTAYTLCRQHSNIP